MGIRLCRGHTYSFQDEIVDLARGLEVPEDAKEYTACFWMLSILQVIRHLTVIIHHDTDSASLLIQGADTYLHIAIESISMIQIYAEAAESHLLSRGIAPWCLSNTTVGTFKNVNFWSCSVTPISDEDNFTIQLTNNSAINLLDIGADKDYALNYTDADGISYAIIGPPRTSPDLDWTATSFAISTQCSAIPFNACNITVETVDEETIFPFSCSAAKGGIDLDANMTFFTHQFHYLDAHKYFPERSGPFRHKGPLAKNLSRSIGLNLTNEDANDVFRNPFRTLNMASVMVDTGTLSDEFLADPRIWSHESFPVYFTIMACNVTGKSLPHCLKF